MALCVGMWRSSAALVESPDLTEADWPEAGARLPASGSLEIFHHVGTYGNVEDEATGGWWRRGQEKALGPVFPASHMFGHSDSGSRHAYAVLSRVRPLRAGA